MLIVVPCLLSSSGSSSSCRTRHQQVQTRSEVTNTHQETGAQKYKTRNGSRDSDDRLRDPPEWLEEFTDKLEGIEAPVPTHVSLDSDTERHMKVVSKSRKPSIHFPRRPKLRSMLENQKYEGSLQKTH